MREYKTNQLRNIALIGHQSTGKTTLAEAGLFVSGYLKQKGEVEKKNTKSDFLLEEQSRGISMSTSLIPIEWNNYKLNFLDVPGNDELIAELYESLNVVKGAVIMIDATKGVEVGTEAVWQEVRNRHIPAVIFINKMDKENINYDQLLEDIREKLGKRAVPFTYPIGRSENFEGFVNVVEMKARIYNGVECIDSEIWPEKLPKVNSLHGMILESVAETDEVLLEKFFGGEEITPEEIKKGLRKGVLEGELTPVIVGSAIKNIGVQTLLSMLSDYLPAPNELKELEALDLNTQKTVTIKTDSDQPFTGYIFKTIVDPFLGSLNFIKINSGSMTPGMEVLHPNSNQTIKINNLFVLVGKDQLPITTAYAGDIVVCSKIDNFKTNDTICDPKFRVEFAPVELPSPVLYKAITPKNKADEDKISVALSRLQTEDPSIDILRNKETHQLLIGGYGLSHLTYIADRMKTLYKVEVDFSDQKIVYRETIKKKGEGEGKHKKQSGGAGQFGHVFIRFEPCEEDFVFDEEIVGGAVPKGYFPAVEKGLKETFEKGPLAGFPVIKVKSTLYFGSYHDVDSNEISFKLAAALAFKNALEKIQPTILEPILAIKVAVKNDFVGDIMGDINKRRGRILGMDQGERLTTVNAEVPESEMTSYSIDLRALTQGSGRFNREFLRYEEVPQHLIPKIIEEYKK